MIDAVAFCPHPPLLVPEVAQGAAAELAELRAACRAAITRVAGRSGTLLVLGSAERAGRYRPTSRGTLAGYGVALDVPLGSDAPGSDARGPVELPLSLTIGGWLLRDALGPNCGAAGYAVAAGGDLDPALAAAARGPDTHALLVMGDGSARRSRTGPGYLDERAAGFDARIADALRTGKTEALRSDPEVAAALLAAGAPAWDAAAALLAGGSWDAELLYDAAPYGVGYFVARWIAGG